MAWLFQKICFDLTFVCLNTRLEFSAGATRLTFMIYAIVWSHRHVVRASFSTVLLSLLSAGAQTEMKRVVGDNATLPCHHQFWQSNGQTLDIEWLLQKPNVKQRVVRNIFLLCPLKICPAFTHCLLFILFQFHLDFVLWTWVLFLHLSFWSPSNHLI